MEKYISNGIYMKKDSKMIEGYMTLEATLVMPVVLMTMIILIYMGFYLFDRCIAGQIAYISALRGSQQMHATSEDIEMHVKSEAETLLKGRLIATDNETIEVECGIRNVIVKIGCVVNMPFPYFESLDVSRWKILREAKVVRLDPTLIIRGIKILKGETTKEISND